MPGEHRDPDTHDRVRHDRVDKAGSITLRHDGRLHHIGIGRIHEGTCVILLVQDLHVRVVNAITGELLRELILNPLRAVKDSDEIAAMRRAAALTDEVYAAITPQLRPGITEREVAEEIWRQGRSRGAEDVSFPTAVLYLGGSSRRGYELPSYSAPLDLPLEKGMGIAFDFGFVLDGYCSDFGRTVFAGTAGLTVIRFGVLGPRITGMKSLNGS